MPLTAHDILMDADLFRDAYPNWPHPEPEPESAPEEPSGEITIGWGEDDPCAGCGYFLAAGTPAWLDEDGRPRCCDCAAALPAQDSGTHADLPDPVHQHDVFARIEASEQ